MTTLWLRFRDVTRTVGPWRALGLAARWGIRREYLVLVHDLTARLPDGGPDASPLAARVRWSLLGGPDIPDLLALNPALRPAEIDRRRAGAQACLLGRLDGLLVHYRWEATGPIQLPYLRRVFEPADGEVLVAEAFTRPAFRGQGLHTLSTLAGLRSARERGFVRSVSVVAWWNAAARRVVQDKADGRVVGTVGYWNGGLRRRYFASGRVRLSAPDRVSLAWTPRARAAPG